MSTLPAIHKRVGNLLPRGTSNEAELVPWNGSLLILSFNQDLTPYGLVIHDFFSGALVAAFQWPGGRGTARVFNGAIHIYGVTPMNGFGNKVIHSVLDANFSPSAPETIYTSPATHYTSNTSVCQVPDGYMIAVEQMDYTGGHSMPFIKGSTPSFPEWNAGTGFVGFAPSGMTACPTMEYLNGYFYVTSGTAGSPYGNTKIMRSQNCVTGSFVTSQQIVLDRDYTSEQYLGDISRPVEFGGNVYFSWMDGDQQTYSDLKSAVYLGTLTQFYADFFR